MKDDLIDVLDCQEAEAIQSAIVEHLKQRGPVRSYCQGASQNGCGRAFASRQAMNARSPIFISLQAQLNARRLLFMIRHE